MSTQASTGQSTPAPVIAPARTPVRFGALLGDVFGPRPLEAALWGLGIGVVFGLPLILGYFMAHFWAVQLQLTAMGTPLEESSSGSEFDVLFWVGFSVLAFGLVGTAGLSVLVAMLRRIALGTIMLVGFATGLLPYLFVYAFFISSP